MSFIVSVIDLTCEQADQSFFPPKVVMSTKSTTQIATVLGFPEYSEFKSFPPKKYHTLSWTGYSEQQLWYDGNASGNSGPSYQIAGAKYDYSGFSQIDSHGNYTNLYLKNLSAQCDNLPNQYTVALQSVGGGLERFSFVGWMGTHGHEVCPPPGIPYDSKGDRAVGKGDLAINDWSHFWGSKQLSALSPVMVSNFVASDSTDAAAHDTQMNLAAATLVICLTTPLQNDTSPGFPIDGTTQGTLWFFGSIIWDHQYTATISGEYTDAEALANAQVIIGNGATTQNSPRTSGFVSSFTSVVYTLLLSDLIVGQNYLLSVDFWNTSTGVTSVNQIGFQATATTKTIISTVPTPIPGQSIQVRNPRITFA